MNMKQFKMEKGAEKLTKWIGSTNSVIFHTIFFITTFCSPLFGVSFDRMMLILTTVVSLEAIYLSIFIQMSINMNNHNIGALQENIEEISEDIEEISEGIEEIQKEDEEEIDSLLTQAEILNSIQLSLNDLQKQLNALKKSKRN